jgi:transglutaminase superfamily protein
VAAVSAPDQRRLPLGARVALACEILATYVRVRWALRRRDLRAVLRELRSPAPAAGADRHAAIGRRLGRAVRRTLALLPTDSRCLMQSLVLTSVLARRGIETQLVIAVRPGERFAAHAWVQHGDEALLPAGAPSFEELVTL